MGDIKSLLIRTGLGMLLLTGATFAKDDWDESYNDSTGYETNQDLPLETVEDTDILDKNLTDHDKELNRRLQDTPPIFMRITARAPSVDDHYNEVRVEVLNSEHYPAPYLATHPGLSFMGFSCPNTTIGVFLENTLIHTFTFEGKKTHEFVICEPKKNINYSGTIDVIEDELNVEVKGYTAGDRYIDPKAMHDPINEIEPNTHVVDRHYGPKKVYKLQMSLLVNN